MDTAVVVWLDRRHYFLVLHITYDRIVCFPSCAASDREQYESVKTSQPSIIRDALIPASDYCVVAFAIIVFISVFQWIMDGRKNFTGPRIDVILDSQPVEESKGPEVVVKE